MDHKAIQPLLKLIERVKKAGMDQADAFYQWARNTEVSARDGEVENLKQSVSAGVGLRVFDKQRLGFGFTSDLTSSGLNALADRVTAIARETAIDKNNGLPDPALFSKKLAAPKIFDPQIQELPTKWLIDAAITMEKVALAQDKRIKTCEDASAGSYVGEVGLANSAGFSGHYQQSYVWIYTGVVAEENDQKQSGSFVDYASFFNDLKNPEDVAKEAARRGLRMLGARKIESAEMPVIYEPDMTKSFMGQVIGAMNGDLIYKKSSFLLDKLGKPIASPLITITDDGTLDRRTGSQPFDGEGLPARRQVLIEKGVLKQYLYDTYTANKAGVKPTGTANRSYASLPGIGTTNLLLEPGDKTPDQLYKGIKKGLLVCKIMGFGANPVNGDYSLGANGCLISNGELATPVHEITLAGNLSTMLPDIDAVGNDLVWRGSSGAPSIRFAKLMVSGK